MDSSRNCPFCGKWLRGGRHRNYITCHRCNTKACLSCSKYGFCLQHYNELTDVQKEKVKSNRSLFMFLTVIIPILCPFIVIPIALLNSDRYKEISEPEIFLFSIIFGLLLVAYIFLMNYLKRRKVQKILHGFEV